MKREEMDALLADTEKDWAEIKRECDSWDEPIATLFRLARLGASVAAPSDEEIEAMAKAACRARGINPDMSSLLVHSDGRNENVLAYAPDLKAIRAALLALRDRANV